MSCLTLEEISYLHSEHTLAFLSQTFFGQISQKSQGLDSQKYLQYANFNYLWLHYCIYTRVFFLHREDKQKAAVPHDLDKYSYVTKLNRAKLAKNIQFLCVY